MAKCWECKKEIKKGIFRCDKCLKLIKEGKINPGVHMGIVSNGGFVAPNRSRDDLKEYGKRTGKTVVEGTDGLIRVCEKV